MAGGLRAHRSTGRRRRGHIEHRRAVPGLPHRRFHDLSRACATLLLQCGHTCRPGNPESQQFQRYR
jgi:hypothetical protein